MNFCLSFEVFVDKACVVAKRQQLKVAIVNAGETAGVTTNDLVDAFVGAHDSFSTPADQLNYFGTTFFGTTVFSPRMAAILYSYVESLGTGVM